jgi:hypothetical protein
MAAVRREKIVVASPENFKRAPFRSICGLNYCSMNITEEIRAMAAERPLQVPVVTI